MVETEPKNDIREFLEKEIEIEIKDNGVGIKDIDKAIQPFYTTKADMERSGMGFTVMEGFMDVIAAYKAGIKASVATMGTALTKQHLKALSALTYTEKEELLKSFKPDAFFAFHDYCALKVNQLLALPEFHR